MRRMRVVLIVLGSLSSLGCSQLERLTIIRPSAHSRGYTQLAPTYDVSGKKAKASSDPAMLLAVATDYYQRGQWNDAERLVRKALSVQAHSGDAYTLLGAIAEARGDLPAAGKAYKTAVDTAPNNGLYANNYGGWLCANGQAAAALPWFDRALADPQYPLAVGAMVNAGSCANKAGQPVQAEVRWRSALALDPQNVPSLAGMAALEFARGNALEARAFVERWLGVTPDDAEGLQLAVKVEQKLGDNAAASRYLSRLQAIPLGSTSVPRTQ